MLRAIFYQNLVTNTLKCAQVQMKLNYLITNIGLCSTRSNVFANRMLQKDQRIFNYYNNSHKSHNEKTTYLIVAGSIFWGIFDMETKDDEESQLIMSIKRCILLIQKGELDKAERMLHVALREAQTMQNYKGITYIFDVMANLAFNTKKYAKAEKLFLTVLQRLLADGISQDDLSIIHISLKLANIYQERGDMEKAETGYQFCLKNLREHLRKDNENPDALQLLGLNLEWYGLMLSSQQRYAEAVQYLIEAYDICVKINGIEHDQTVILLNDLGSVTCMAGEYDRAIDYLSRAAEIGKNLPEMDDLEAIHINLGNVFLKKGLYDQAKKWCNYGRKFAKSRNNKDSVREAEKCLAELKKLKS